MNCLRTPRFAAALAVVAVTGMTSSACLGAQVEAGTPQSFNGATATATHGDLASETIVQGSLHYANPYTLKSASESVATALPTSGTTLTQRSHVYTVTGNNTYLLHGSTPTWRALEEGTSDSEDVTQLETALSELGYFEATPNAHFDWNIIAAIERRQEALSLPQSGSLPPDTVLFAPEDLRISALKTRVGTSTTMETELFTVSSSRQVISANLKLSDQALGVVGDSVTVCLSGSTMTTTGTITSVEPSREEGSEEGSKETNKERIIPITVTPDDTSAPEGFQEASVPLGLTSETRKDVLSVPLGAFVALSTDQLGVGVVDEKGEVRQVPVTVGLFVGDRVEMSSDEIAEGQRVVVPDR